MYYELLFYCLLTSLVSVGFYLATEPNNILHFLKRPVRVYIEELEAKKQKELSECNQQEAETESYSDPEKWKEYFAERRKSIRESYDDEISFFTKLFKPVFLCPRCMGSVWSLLIWFPLTIANYNYDIALNFLAFAMLITCVMNSVIFNHSDL